MSKKKLFLTGANGFVGQHVQAAVISGVWGDEFELCPPGPPIDIGDEGALRSKLEQAQPDVVIHLAAQSHVLPSFDQPEETLRINFHGTFNLLKCLAAAGFKGRMLYIGSADTYGLVDEKDLPIRETQPLRPRNPYAVSKIAAEALCYQWSQTGPFEIVMARPFNHIGPGQADTFAVSYFARKIVEISVGRTSPEILVGDLDVTRDFTDVRDIVAAYLALLLRGESGEVYNIGSGQERRMSAVLQQLVEIAGASVEVVRDPARMRPAEQKRLVCDAAKLRTATGWATRIPFERTLKDTLQDWRGKLGVT